MWSHSRVFEYLEPSVMAEMSLFSRSTSCSCWLTFSPMSRVPLNELFFSFLSQVSWIKSVYLNLYHSLMFVIFFPMIISALALTHTAVVENWITFVELGPELIHFLLLWPPPSRRESRVRWISRTKCFIFKIQNRNSKNSQGCKRLYGREPGWSFWWIK